MLFLQLFIHLFEVLNCCSCNKKSFVVQVVVNFVTLLNSRNWINFDLDMRFVIDKHFTYMFKKIIYRACTFLWSMIAVFMVFGRLAVVMILENATHLERNIWLDDFLNILVRGKWWYFVFASYYLASLILYVIWRVALVHDSTILFYVKVGKVSKIVDDTVLDGLKLLKLVEKDNIDSFL